MKILLYGINFAPEPTGIGKYTGEMATWLAAAGHEVRVVTAPPYYPHWKIEPGYRTANQKWEHRDGVKIWRSPLWVPKKLNGGTRLLHLLSFAVGSLPALFGQVTWRPDVVFVVAPAMVCAPAGWLVAKLCGAKAWLHIQDFEVDAAFRLGLLQPGWTQRVATAVERVLLNRFDRVSTISHRMMERLTSKGVSDRCKFFFPNWVDISAITPLREPSSYRAELGISNDTVVALYSGSMAAKQGLHLLVEAARAMEKSTPRLLFVLCGDGVIKPSLERDCAGLSNVIFLPLQPSARLGDLLGLADIHLLPQSSQAADLVMPSKLTGMLASGRPVVTTANAGTELARVVAARGAVVPPDDLKAFVDALQKLNDDDDLRTRLGKAARFYAEDCLARDRVLVQLEQGLNQCISIAKSSMPIGLPAVVDKEPLA